jgi:hypothetical protein
MSMMLQKTAQAFKPQAIRVAGMATEKQLVEKMTSTKNIRKITSSMKMVAAAKLKGDQTRLAVRRRCDHARCAFGSHITSAGAAVILF